MSILFLNGNFSVEVTVEISLDIALTFTVSLLLTPETETTIVVPLIV